MTSLLIAEGWATLCRIALVEHSLTRFPPPWRSVRCSVTEVHPCREDQSIRIAVSTVTRRFMLKLDLTTQTTIIKLLFPGLLPRKGVEEVISEALLIITTYYYTMRQQLLLHCYFMIYMNCWLISSCASRLV